MINLLNKFIMLDKIGYIYIRFLFLVKDYKYYESNKKYYFEILLVAVFAAALIFLFLTTKCGAMKCKHG